MRKGETKFEYKICVYIYMKYVVYHINSCMWCINVPVNCIYARMKWDICNNSEGYPELHCLLVQVKRNKLVKN